MNKLNSVLVQNLTTFCLLLALAVTTTRAATIIQNPKLAAMKDGFLEIKPNGSLILRSSLHNSSSVWQEALILKAILNAIRSMPLQTKTTLNELNEKMYGEGEEHKFPPFLERVIQRIQTYFSIYKYTDTSEPVQEDSAISFTPTTTATSVTTVLKATPSPVTTTGNVNATLTLAQQNQIQLNLNNGSLNSQTIETSTVSSSGTTEKPTVLLQAVAADEDENEFIEIKDEKSLSS